MEKRPRLEYVDWLRGLATVCMIQAHAINAWLRGDHKGSDFYQVSQMLAGLPAVLFLFLTGISLVIVLERCERRGESPWKVVLRRSGYILVIAVLFRIQQWASYWRDSPVAGILKVDILNTIAVGLGVAGVAILLVPGRLRPAGAAVGAVAAAMLTPLAWSIPAEAEPWFLLAYLRGGAQIASFPLFPWVSYTFTGVLVGLLIVGQKDRTEVDRTMQWLVLLALCLVVVARFFDSLPYTYYQPYRYWLTSPNLVANRTAVALLLLAAGYGWSRMADPGRFSCMRQMGQNTLLIYWVHVELVYGRSGSLLRGWMDQRQALAATVTLTALMLLLSTAKTRWWTPERRAACLTILAKSRFW